MRFSVVLILCLLFTPLAKTQDLKMVVWSDDITPIIFWDPESQSYQGIVIDVFAGLKAQHLIKLNFEIRNRKKAEQALYEGSADFSIFSREWMTYPDKLIYSEPIYVQREFLYANSPIEHSSLKEAVLNKTICTRKGFVYPKLTEYFTLGHARRMDALLEVSQFHMLRKNRCDFVVTNELVGDWLIEQNGWKSQVFRSRQITDTVNFTMAFHPSQKRLLAVVNAHVRQLIADGTLAKMIAYQSNAAHQMELDY